MMMKLMKVLVVALVAGGVCAPVASQAGSVDGKALKCERKANSSSGEKDLGWSAESKALGENIMLIKFDGGRVYRYRGPTFIEDPPGLHVTTFKSNYVERSKTISWEPGYKLNRSTLVLISNYAYPGWIDAECELIDPDEILVLVQPFLDHHKTLHERETKGNKL